MSSTIVIDKQNILDTIHAFLSESDFFEDKEIVISDDLKKLAIAYDGKAFNSSIPTGVMRSFLGLQESIHEIYSLHAYGEKRKLPPETKKELEIVVVVEEGSSLYNIDIGSIIDAVANRVGAMTGAEFIGTAAALCVTFLISTLGSKAMNHRAERDRVKAELERKRLESDSLTAVQKNTADAIISATQQQQSFYRATLQQGFEKLSINGEAFAHEDLREMISAEKRRHPVESKIYAGRFRITAVRFGDNGNFLDATGISGGHTLRNVSVLVDIMGADNFRWVKDSASGLEVEMTVVATVKNGEIIASFLQSFSLPQNDAE